MAQFGSSAHFWSNEFWQVAAEEACGRNVTLATMIPWSLPIITKGVFEAGEGVHRKAECGLLNQFKEMSSWSLVTASKGRKY